MHKSLQHARGAFADLLNALDEARAVTTEHGDEALDLVVAEIERAVRRFDAAFDAEKE